MPKEKDIYFFNAQEALQTALERNEGPSANPRVPGLQICYYNHEEPLENTPDNCIWVPLENVYNYFVTTRNRMPTNLSFISTEYTEEDQRELTKAFNAIMDKAIREKTSLVLVYQNEISKLKPDFSEKKWRVFIPACRETTAMQYISKNIANAFEYLGYDVYYHIQDNGMQNCTNMLPHLHDMLEFNPHITININHLVNQFLSDDIHNFVWFQDLMPILLGKEEVHVRKNDHIFALTEAITKQLAIKDIKDSVLQPFCIDTTVYKPRDEIKKENKMVFIGSSYRDHYNMVKNPKKDKVLKELLAIYLEQGVLTKDEKNKIQEKYRLKGQSDLGHIVNYIERDMVIKEILKLDLDIELELYGHSWDKDEDLLPYYKGVLGYGEDISKVYNSAKYALVSGGYIMQQRVLEAAASGSIPVVLDVRKNDETYEEKYDNSMVFFEKPEDLLKLSDDEQDYDLNLLIKKHTYIGFAERMIECVKKAENGK